MHGMITLLDSPFKDQVEAIWDELEFNCGLSGVKLAPLPHFSWQVAARYELTGIQSVLADAVRSCHPFMVQTTGLGVFTGAVPVIYIPIIKNEPLIQLHQALWEATAGLCQGRNEYYAPPIWVPHITLAVSDVDGEKVACAASRLAFRSFNWEFPVNNLVFFYQTAEHESWLRYRYDFLTGEIE